MIGFDEQLEFFKLIGTELNKKVICYAIGGSAMMFYGAKVETKDVDLVFLNKEELDLVKKALYNIGFEKKKTLITIFKHYELAKNKPVMMVGKDTRFDLFLNEIITFRMSESIIDRVKEVHEFKNLIVKIVCPEDIILLKSATEREKDRIDALSLIKKFKLNWDIIIKESIHQTTIEGDIFPIFLFDFLYELKEDLKADIPKQVIDKIRKISEDLLEERLKGKTVRVSKSKTNKIRSKKKTKKKKG